MYRFWPRRCSPLSTREDWRQNSSSYRHFSTSRRSLQNHYQVLGISVNASAKEIKKRFYELSKKYHPDRNKDVLPEKYQQITAAYDVLSNDDKRRQFDNTLGEAARRPEGYSASGKRSWQGTARAASGYKFHGKPQYKAAHQARSNPDLDPLKYSYRDSSANDVPHFDSAKHFAAQQRSDAHRERRTRQRREAYGKMHPAQSTSSSPVLPIIGGIASAATILYLLLR